MKNKQNINGVLDRFGLTSYEAKSYLSLLERKQLSATEISRIANVPRGRIYDTLQQLELKGLCKVESGKIKLYTAVEPSQLGDVLINLEKDRVNSKINQYQSEIQKEKNQLVDYIKKTENLVEKLTPIYKQNRENEKDSDYIEVIKDPLLAHKKTCEIFTNAKKEILGFSRPPYAVTEKLSEQRNKDIQQGVVIRNIFEMPTNVVGLKDVINSLKALEIDREVVRIADRLPIKLVIVDEEFVLCSLYESLTFSQPLVITALVKNKNWGEFYKMAFETMWAKSRELDIDELKLKLQKMIEEGK